MNRDLNIILIEDDKDTCKRFTECAETTDGVTILSATDSSSKALELVIEYLPDVVILDLELNQGKGNGLLFLQGLNDLSPDFKPFILISTNNSSSTIYEYARKLGADFIMFKHQQDYSEQKVLDFLIMMKEIIQQSHQHRHPGYAAHESPHKQEKRLNRLITMELDKIGISPKVIGYKYLTDAILLVIRNRKCNLCASIGQKYGKTDSSVERAMQNAINKAWRTNDIDELLKHYTAKISSEKGVPTLTEFIYYYATKIENFS
ncbi:MAG: response regulator [Bacteroidales bacterium]|nr:response regulator [Clostridium sp.]MCM1203012.1 response regulator [Bacteroidales bacterium]